MVRSTVLRALYAAAFVGRCTRSSGAIVSRLFPFPSRPPVLERRWRKQDTAMEMKWRRKPERRPCASFFYSTEYTTSVRIVRTPHRQDEPLPVRQDRVRQTPGQGHVRSDKERVRDPLLVKLMHLEETVRYLDLRTSYSYFVLAETRPACSWALGLKGTRLLA